jgi:hypothetical protein
VNSKNRSKVFHFLQIDVIFSTEALKKVKNKSFFSATGELT